VLDPLVAALPAAVDSDDSESEDPFVPTEACRTTVDGLYVAGWMSGETAHQVGVNAGHGARAGLAVARDDMSDRYWPAVGERYVDWVVHDGYFTDRGRDLPPGCEEIGDAERREREAESRELMRERFAEPHPDEQETQDDQPGRGRADRVDASAGSVGDARPGAAPVWGVRHVVIVP
jgi:hypothetical protein